MREALYHPQRGYYRSGRDVFGKAGDFYTAEQLQPVFGILIARLVRHMFHELGEPEDFTVVELGAGRAEMRAAFSDFRYHPVEVGQALPDRITGVVFANEFFDALPVDVACWRKGAYKEVLVAERDGHRFWVEGERPRPEIEQYLERYVGVEQEGAWAEANLEALDWVRRIAAALDNGYLLAIDYGYTRREAVRFPSGTLMSYRRHQALEDVLNQPGERDLSAHVNFTALQEQLALLGFTGIRLEPLGLTLLRAGQQDHFREALEAAAPAEARERRSQLKTLLFEMGECYRTLEARKGGK